MSHIHCLPIGSGIPVCFVMAKGLAEAWELSLIATNEYGCPIKTQYDKPEDPPSKDCTMTMVIENPLSEPMIHKDFPGGPADLQEYTMEVLDGIKDHLVRDPNDPNDKRWEYTYHQRLFDYTVPGITGTSFRCNQIESLCEKLAKQPYSRQAQAITWKVWEDSRCYDPACLQSIWCRLLPMGDKYILNTNVRFRSNDAYKAAFMNIFALTMLQKRIAERISQLMGKEVVVGRYVHEADSYHIYGSYFKEFECRFLSNLKSRSFEDRTFRYEDMKPIMDESIPEILEKMKTFAKE